jgi:hypothetical protein
MKQLAASSPNERSNVAEMELKFHIMNLLQAIRRRNSRGQPERDCFGRVGWRKWRLLMIATARETTTFNREGGKPPTIGLSFVASLTEAVQKYFDLMYDCDTSRFDEVFRSTAHLHGFRDGQMMAWSAQVYKDILDKRQSPKSLGAVRADEILLMDFASTEQALVKVRVRIAAMEFVDHLTWHRIDGKWLITSKGFHLVSDGAS